MKVNESEIRTILKLNEESNDQQNIIKIHEIIDDDNLEDKLVIVMEYCSQGQLLNWCTEDHKFVVNEQLADPNNAGFLAEEVIKKAILDVAAGL